MVDLRRPFRCEVITPRGRKFAGELVSAVFPASDGLVGVLGGRGPLLMLLGSGEFRARRADGGEDQYYISGGFARFHENFLCLLAEECVPMSRVDPDEAWEEILAAQRLPRETPQDEAFRDEQLKAARDKFNLAQRYKRETERS